MTDELKNKLIEETAAVIHNDPDKPAKVCRVCIEPLQYGSHMHCAYCTSFRQLEHVITRYHKSCKECNSGNHMDFETYQCRDCKMITNLSHD